MVEIWAGRQMITGPDRLRVLPLTERMKLQLWAKRSHGVRSVRQLLHLFSAADRDDRPFFNVQAVDGRRDLTERNAPPSPSRAEWPSQQVSGLVRNKPHGPTRSYGCSTVSLMGGSLTWFGSVMCHYQLILTKSDVFFSGRSYENPFTPVNMRSLCLDIKIHVCELLHIQQYNISLV